MNILRICFTILLLSIMGMLAYDGFFIARIFRNVRTLQSEATSIRTIYEKNDIPTLLNTFITIAPEITNIHEDLKKPILIPQLPYLRHQVAALRMLSNAIHTTVNDTMPLAYEFKNILALMPSAKSHFEDIPPAVKKEILARIVKQASSFAIFTTHLQDTLRTLNTLDQVKLLPSLTAHIITTRTFLTQVAQSALKAQTLIDVLPRMIGYQTPQSYLLLFMNNFELRPGGGFIGTYGIVKVKDGDVLEITTDDIYNLDRPSHKRLTVSPPPQLTRYLFPPSFNKWLLRDSNWSPDFATNAQRALSFYRLEEGAHANDLNGVIALTPTLIADMLKLTGPITIEGETFTADNVFDVLEWHVEKGYVGKRIPASQRKEIIGPFANALKTAVLRLPLSRFMEIINVITDNLQQRHLMAFTLDPEVNSALQAHDAQGPHITKTPRDEDFLMVIDANVRGLKTDQVIEKNIDYHVAQNLDTSLSATVTLTYKNTGKFSWKWGTYRSYTRILVPEGSMLINAAQEIEVDNELSHASFGTFFTLDPGQEKTIVFRYILPEAIAENIENGTYTLHILKQAGTLKIPLTFTLNSAKITKQITTDLQIDRHITL